MQNNSIKNNDDLILGIKTILSEKNRCSFTDEEQVLLRDCIKQLEASKAEPDVLAQAKTFISVLEVILKVFTFIDHVKDLF